MSRTLRIVSIAIGVIIMAIYALAPSMTEQIVELNTGDGAIQLTDGMQMEVELKSSLTQYHRAGVRLGEIGDAGSLSVTLALLCGKETAVQKTFPLEGRRPQAILQLEAAEPLTGKVTLRIEAQGEGIAFLAASDAGSPYVRCVGNIPVRNLSVLYLGMTMVLLALVPVGRKEARRA